MPVIRDAYNISRDETKKLAYKLLFKHSKTDLTYHLRRYTKKKTSWSEFASELYRPSDRRLSAK
jgi:hypothetical protein